MKENRKILYTKRVLRESLMELLKTKPIGKITVKELCRVADLNRSTFYSHYKDVYEIIEQMESHIVESVLRNINIDGITADHQVEVFEAIFNELKSNQSELELVYLNQESMKCITLMFDQIYEISSKLLKERFKDIEENQIKYVYGFISRGCAQMGISWIENGMKEEPRAMALLMSRTLKGEFYY
jgi:AcrR family transcriptional regulator